MIQGVKRPSRKFVVGGLILDPSLYVKKSLDKTLVVKLSPFMAAAVIGV